MSEKNKAPLKGINIYIDKKGRTVYYDRLSKNGYIIPPNKFDNYTNYSIRFIVAILVGYLAALFLDSNYLAGFLVGVSAYIAYTFIFHKRFLSKLSIIPNFNPPYRENYINRNIKEMPMKRVYTIIAIALILLVLIAINAVAYGLEGWSSIVYLAIALVAVGFIAVHGYILIQKRKQGLD